MQRPPPIQWLRLVVREPPSPLMPLFLGHLVYDFHCADGDGRNALYQINHRVFVVCEAVGVEFFANKLFFSLRNFKAKYF